jgi:hypothetical protein
MHHIEPLTSSNCLMSSTLNLSPSLQIALIHSNHLIGRPSILSTLDRDRHSSKTCRPISNARRCFGHVAYFERKSAALRRKIADCRTIESRASAIGHITCHFFYQSLIPLKPYQPFRSLWSLGMEPFLHYNTTILGFDCKIITSIDFTSHKFSQSIAPIAISK